jgi:UDP-N-acetylglucosamine enolpyruvyl transferase
MTSFFGFLSKNPDTPDTKKEDKDFKGISENALIGEGSYKKIFSITNDVIDNSSFMVDKDFKTFNHVIANITKYELEKILNKIKTMGGRKNKRKTQKKKNKNKKKTQKKRP